MVRMYEELHHCMWPVDDDDDDGFYIQNPVNEFQKPFSETDHPSRGKLIYQTSTHRVCGIKAIETREAKATSRPNVKTINILYW